MRVFIANFGHGNYLWPKCLQRNTVATINNECVHALWEAGDRAGFIALAIKELKTARMEVPTRAVASRWYGLNDAIAETSGDLWIHRDSEKDLVWWTVSHSSAVEISLEQSANPQRDGQRVYELHKAADPWSYRDRKGRQLSWKALHPKAKDFLFTEGTLQQLSPDNAEYAMALIDGAGLDGWHNRPDWRLKLDAARSKPVTFYDARKKAIYRMVDTVFSTVANANGQQVMQSVKEKNTTFDRGALEKYIDGLISDQDGLCALTGIPLQYDREGPDPELWCSLDRIDSGGHYVPGNLQVVCKFANRWKSDSQDSEFRRLIQLVRSHQF